MLEKAEKASELEASLPPPAELVVPVAPVAGNTAHIKANYLFLFACVCVCSLFSVS